MTGQNQGFAEAVARYRADLAAAVTRSRRAAAEARDQSANFRAENDDLAKRIGKSKVAPAERTDEDRRAAAEEWRRAQGLPVTEFPPDADRVVEPAEPEHAPRPDDDDDDFSQHSVLFRG
ncbi:hypothetical protein [Actinokineospora sp.]|uniref:hypothetical protein n=1 Tax=Actinokineospora sp. TaxID=1872133 RepID=UPI003D6B753B